MAVVVDEVVEVVVFGVTVVDETYKRKKKKSKNKKARIKQNHVSSIENLTLGYEPVSLDTA